MKNQMVKLNTITIIAFMVMMFPTLLFIEVLADSTMSPRQQMESGTDPQDVECKPGMVLMIRATNGAAACVTSSTSEKLADAGWGEIIRTQPMTDEPKDIEVNLEESLDLETGDPNEDEGEVKKVEIEESVGTESKGP